MIRKVDAESHVVSEDSQWVNVEAYWTCPYCDSSNVQRHQFLKANPMPVSTRVIRDMCFMCDRTVDVVVEEPDFD